MAHETRKSAALGLVCAMIALAGCAAPDYTVSESGRTATARQVETLGETIDRVQKHDKGCLSPANTNARGSCEDLRKLVLPPPLPKEPPAPPPPPPKNPGHKPS